MPTVSRQGGPGPAEHGHAAAAEHVFQHHRRVGVLMRHDPVTGGDQGDLGAEGLVGAGELGPGDPGAHHDQLRRQFRQAVELPPGQDALTIRLGPGQHPGQGAGGDEHRASLDLLVPDDDLAGPGEPAPARDDLHSLGRQAQRDVGGLGLGQCLDPRVQPGRVHGRQRPAAPAARPPAAGHVAAGPVAAGRAGSGERRPADPDTEVLRALDHGHGAGRGDQGLGRDAVGQHARAAEAVAVHHRHPRAKLCGYQGRLVSAGPAPQDHDARTRLAHDASFCPYPPGATNATHPVPGV
jgi:hypothetical protein